MEFIKINEKINLYFFNNINYIFKENSNGWKKIFLKDGKKNVKIY